MEEGSGEADEHNWWKLLAAGCLLLPLLYFLLAWYLSQDECPEEKEEIPVEEPDNPRPMVRRGLG